MELRYTKNFDLLVALVTHLSNVPYISRRPSKIALDLGVNVDEVTRILNSFPAFFRKSRDTNEETNEHYYAVHIRYARGKGEKKEEVAAESLDPAELAAMIEVITNVVAQEQATSRLNVELSKKYRGLFWTNIVTLAVALIAAIAAIFAAVINGA